ncbi:ETC complex I subunit [Rickettsiaceae bacterium]|nr:ETC complex I subunit [Rickettsiaceae bacterium]
MQVRISKPARSSMQYGKNEGDWLMEYVREPNARYKESYFGRTTSKDMGNEVRISFDNLESAIKFADKNHYSYEVIQPKKTKLHKKSYASNFR